jgi:predicted phosphate transport protein (TIGR00153 family)
MFGGSLISIFNISKREDAFFSKFNEVGEVICQSAELIDGLMKNYVCVEEKDKELEEKEHACDNLVHNILELINKSFITPIDREDINLIAKELDNIVDSIESAAHRFCMFDVKEVREEAIEMTKLIVECTKALKEILFELGNMKTSKTLTKKIIEVNRIEGLGDDLFRKAIKRLFKEESSAIEILKWKEIFEFLEDTLDTCEDVANTIEGVVTKHV